MSDETEPPPMRQDWRDVPTVFVDLPMAHATANGLLRLILGEAVFDYEEGITRPKTRPVFNLTMPLNAVPHLMEYLQDVLDRQAEIDAKNAGR